MKERKVFRSAVVIMLAVVMTIAFMPLAGAGQANAAAKKGRLVKKVKVEEYNVEEMAYQPSIKIAYKYNKKGDPVKIKKNYYDQDGALTDSYTMKNVYRYKNGKRYKNKISLYDGWKSNATYDKNGRLSRIVEKIPSGDKYNTYTYTIKWTKKGYLKKRKAVAKFTDNTTAKAYFKQTVKQRKSGLLKKSAGYESRDGKRWTKIESTAYNTKGLITKHKFISSYTDEPDKFYYTYKNGRVSKVIVTGIDSDGVMYKVRFTFSYTNKKTGKIRYAKMINSILTYQDTDISTNAFNWF